jgi:hypothetical protein
MQNGWWERARPVVSALAIGSGALVGLAVGALGFLFATAFPAMLRMALPNMSDTTFVALWALAVAVPVLGFRNVLRKGDRGARAYAACGIATIALLFGGELTGTIHYYPWHARLYMTPGPLERPENTSPPRADASAGKT